MARATTSASSSMDERSSGQAAGLTFERRWTRPGVHPYDEIAWEIRTAAIGNEAGKLVFEQKDVEVPRAWSQLATNVVVSKYFRGHLGTPERETQRPAADRPRRATPSRRGRRRSATSRRTRTSRRSSAELTHLLVHQKMAFNSPVWFNVGDRGAARSAPRASSTRSRTR